MYKLKRETTPDFMIPGLDRRKYPRFSNPLPVEYRQVDESRVRLGYANNICEGGLMISLTDQPAVGEGLQLKIFFVSGRNLRTVDAIEVTGRVVWSKPATPKVGYYQIGLKFENISPEDVESLRRFLNHFGKRY
jgi:c-di-GMP-binding flagellar brake protein YcgR